MFLNFKYSSANCRIVSSSVGSFENWEKIDEGGFGAVFSAYSKNTDEIVALKRLHNSPTSAQEFAGEVKNITKVNHHNNIIRHFYELDWQTKIRMAKEISSGINCLHIANLVHRDLHDKNILVHNGRPMIADFGLSKSLGNNSMSIAAGKFAYSDPLYLQDPQSYKRGKPFDIYTEYLLMKATDLEIFFHVTSGHRETPINGTPVDFMNLYCDCWNNDPKLRPNIIEIRHRLNTIKMESVYYCEQNGKMSAKTLRQRGEFNCQRQSYEKSLIYLNKSLEIEPNYVDTLISRGITYYKMFRFEESLADLNKSLKIDQNNIEALKLRGKTYRKMDRYEESLADLNKLLRINPKDALVLRLRGATYRRMNRYKSSLEDLNKSLDIDPNNAVTLGLREATYRRIGKYKESLADLNKSLKIDPNNADTLSFRGATYRRIGKYKESLKDFNKSLKIEPNNADTLSQRGETFRMMGMYEESLADLNKSLEINPNSTDAFSFRAYTYLNIGSFEKSLVDSRKTLEIDPNNEVASNYVVWNLFIHGFNSKYRSSRIV
ncbi:hypothetical protein C2G38_2252833 [Gigaspora rosea]|uniref:Protein kinase domain-containing protein n=1 Tax=Gigaspora rosea TaxID=44941 RepID=A0A397UA13_9GLOM|nr:hypothetical protein C2G38_2252833 [Gigaspora rosea]